MAKQKRLVLPVVTMAAEHLVVGHLMRRNIMTYKAPPRNEGYDLICIHPDPQSLPSRNVFKKLIYIQVKSRYATDAYRTFPLTEKSLKAFDYLIVAFLNIGKFFGKKDGLTGDKPPVFYTLPQKFIKKHHQITSKWQQVNLRKLTEDELKPYENEAGFEQIAKALGIPKPQKKGKR